MQLNKYGLASLREDLHRPNYLDDDLKQGMVHIGVGGFHRAHQAMYTHKLLQQHLGREWTICGVGLREADRAMQQVLSKQDFLYSLVELGADGKNEVSVIGAIRDFLFAPDDPQAVIEKLANPEVRIVSLTITEGGYNVDDSSGAFNVQHPDIQHDLKYPLAPRSVFGFLTEALARRAKQGVAPFTVMSCDNLPHNGDVARKALLAFAELRDADLKGWIEQHVTFPNGMVDRITPGTTPERIQWFKETYGVEDGWPVICEPFSQWVLEDKFCNGRPPWEEVGVQFTGDVTPYELMKIRLLNASHSAMAYLGILAGYRFTNQVMEDPLFVSFIRDFMDLDVTPGLGVIAGVDLDSYKQTLIERFSNPQISDQLQRLCLDGSSKIPKFVLPTIEKMLDDERPLQRVALILASWAHYLRGRDDNGETYAIQDPLAERLQSAVSDRPQASAKFLSQSDIFGQKLSASTEFVQAFEQALANIENKGAIAALKSL